MRTTRKIIILISNVARLLFNIEDEDVVEQYMRSLQSTLLLGVVALTLVPNLHADDSEVSTKSLKKIRRALSLNDPNSFSNPEDVRAGHIDVKWNVDFEAKVLNGTVLYSLVASRAGVDKMIFDSRDLHIHDIKDGDGNRLDFELGDAYLKMGRPLIVSLPPFLPADSNGTIRGEISIAYQTSPNSSALQWLTKEMTGEKKFPFLFSQSAPIHARSLLPCQDTSSTKSTYTTAITAPEEAVVLFGGLSAREPKYVAHSKRLHSFVQKIPIPSYLVAIAVGLLESAEIGPRSRVWAEKSLLADAAFDFSETEKMIQAAESIVGKYVWERYDILVLPPSFPFGGMENPCLTFATPTLLTHDKSLANVIAHEIAHSWTGNLVSNKNFEHFWIKESFTVFIERKILGIISGEPERQFASIEGWTALQETVDTMGEENPLTKLVLDLRGIDPDDSYSTIAYEKGYVLLYDLETKVGGAAVMNGFLRHFVDTFKYKSIDSYDFKNNFIQYFISQGKEGLIKDVNWDEWFNSPGMPKKKPDYDTTLYDACALLSERWLNWTETTPNPFSPSDLTKLSPSQIQEFLQILLFSEKNLTITKLKVMNETYGFDNYRNAEVRVRWLRIGLRARWLDQLTQALQFVTDTGRMKYIRPVYRDLYDWEQVRAAAIETFKRNRPSMTYLSAEAVAKDLHLDDETQISSILKAILWKVL